MIKIAVTGGYGFIGSAFIRHIAAQKKYNILNIDKLTYASNLDALKNIGEESYKFQKIDLCNYEELKIAIINFNPELIIHFAAESHVDNSLYAPRTFIESNIVGTFNLLEVIRELNSQNHSLRFLHVSTDEVYGDLEDSGELFTEDTPYSPSSPYSASKASSDHLVRSWFRSFGIPSMITNCSNNYGPYQHKEKLIPVVINNALNGLEIPIYGDGKNIRDWLYVDDHAKALESVLLNGKVGHTYNIGGGCQKSNNDIVQLLCQALDNKVSQKPRNISSFSELVTFVKDRPGHDRCYGIDYSKIANELGWQPSESIESGINKTIDWFLEEENIL